MPKDVGNDTKHETYCMICIVLYFIECICWLIYRNVLPVCHILRQRSETNGGVTCKKNPSIATKYNENPSFNLLNL